MRYGDLGILDLTHSRSKSTVKLRPLNLLVCVLGTLVARALEEQQAVMTVTGFKDLSSHSHTIHVHERK